jgi:hypothetical protein
VKLPAYTAGQQKRIFFINDNSVYIPLFGKEGQGRFLEIFFVKSPLIPLFQSERLERKTFHPRLQNGVIKFIPS